MNNFLINDNTFGSKFTAGDIALTYDWVDEIPYSTEVKILNIVSLDRVFTEILDVDVDVIYEDLCENADYDEDEDDLWERAEDIRDDLIGRSMTFHVEDLEGKEQCFPYVKKNFLPITEEPPLPPKESFFFMLKRRAGGYTMMIHEKLISSKLMLKKKVRGFRSRLSSFFHNRFKRKVFKDTPVIQTNVPIVCGAGLLAQISNANISYYTSTTGTF